jgi:REP element-mobilizing transposase RayT
LREHSLFVLVRQALAAGKRRFGFSLVHFSVQRDHLHLIAEASDGRALSRGVQGLAIRIARAVNRQLARKGRLFADRYHARALKTPREVRFALRYVLLNVRKHAGGLDAGDSRGHEGGVARRREGGVARRRDGGRGGPRGTREPPAGFVDSCSSAPWFVGFERPEELAFGAHAARAEWLRTSGSAEPPVVAPDSWLLRRSPQRVRSFDVDEIPGG